MEKEARRMEVKGIPTHGGKYLLYNILGNTFEVSSKYVPPIQPVGRGAYGIVCCAKNAETNEGVAIKKINDAFNNSLVWCHPLLV